MVPRPSRVLQFFFSEKIRKSLFQNVFKPRPLREEVGKLTRKNKTKRKGTRKITDI